MKDWRVITEHESMLIEYEPHLDVDEEPSWREEERQREEFGKALRAELAPAMKALGVDSEQPEDEGMAAPGQPPNELYLVLRALEAYVTLRVVADDIRFAIAKVRERRGHYIRIPEDTAMLLAWDHVAAPDSHVEAELQSIMPISRLSDSGHSVQTGWLVQFDVDEVPTAVVVSIEGDVMGTTAGVDLSLVPTIETLRWDDQDDEEEEDEGGPQ